MWKYNVHMCQKRTCVTPHCYYSQKKESTFQLISTWPNLSSSNQFIFSGIIAYVDDCPYTS